jgi:hypothetical protein
VFILANEFCMQSSKRILYVEKQTGFGIEKGKIGLYSQKKIYFAFSFDGFLELFILFRVKQFLIPSQQVYS